MEASAIPASVGLARTRIAIAAPLLRLRSDEQLVSLFRAGSEEAFRAIHDRYRQRILAYTRQMLGGSAADPEDAVQEIFVRAYAGLRASDRELALRAWLYRIAHNRCIDELRRPRAVATDVMPAAAPTAASDPVARSEQRDALRRLIVDVQRLPEQQRSALLMRELGGMTYADVSGALSVSVPAVKSLLVRARVGLAQASEARDTACSLIREELIGSHDRGVRVSGLVRRHLRDCDSCREFRFEVRGVSRQLAAYGPAVGPLGVIAKLLGLGGGGGAAVGGWAASGGGVAAGGGATGAVATAGAAAGAGHVVTILAAAVVTAGGAIELQHIAPPGAPHPSPHRLLVHAPRPTAPAHRLTVGSPGSAGPAGSATSVSPAAAAGAPGSAAQAEPAATSSGPSATGRTPAPARADGGGAAAAARTPSLAQVADPDNMIYLTALNRSTADSPPSSGATGAGSSGTPAAGAPAAGPSTEAATAGSASGQPPAATAATTASGTGQATTAPGTAGSGSAATGAAGGSRSTGAGPGTGNVTPATAKGPVGPAPTGSAKATTTSGAVAVFTMTGN